MKASTWKLALVMGLVIAACFVPALEELEEERGRECNAEHACGENSTCVEGHCQPEEGSACRAGARAACGQDTGACQQGNRTCGADGRYGACEGAVAPSAETCNGKDDDCDGQSDEGLSCDDAGDPCAHCTAAGRMCADGECGSCLEGYYAQGEQCLPLVALGGTCSREGMCASGHCVDGVCCNNSCEGPCEQCNKTPGNCTPVEGGNPGAPDCAPYRCDGTAGRCPIQCQGNANCADGVPCINNRCGDKLPPGGSCSSAEQCASGNCVGGFCCTSASCNESEGQCYQAAGTCSSGTCRYLPKSAGTGCDDGNACTVDDACDGHGSCSGRSMSCPASTNQCEQPLGTCVNGTCSYSWKPVGTSCNDQDPCTNNDACDALGVCSGVALSCNEPPPQCYGSTGVCSSGSCMYPPKAAGSSCDDGNGCTINDHCDGAGVCVVTALSCAQSTDQCREPVGTCSNGGCSFTPKSAGVSCNDGNACTVDDACNGNGACVGSANGCDDSNECTLDSCDPSSGCSHTNRNYGSVCGDDGRSCTFDICDGNGMCSHPQNCPRNEVCGSDGVCQCNAPYTRCDGSQGGVCTVLNLDSHNCGACGVDCHELFIPPPGGIIYCDNGSCRCIGRSDPDGNQELCQSL